MSVTLREAIESAGYNLDTLEDSQWLLSKQEEFAELIELAEERQELHDDDMRAEAELEDSDPDESEEL